MKRRDILENWGSMSKREFKRRELEQELGHEDEWERQKRRGYASSYPSSRPPIAPSPQPAAHRAPIAPDAGQDYHLRNAATGKLLSKDGQPSVFSSERHARAVAAKLKFGKWEAVPAKGQGVAEGSKNQLPVVLYRELPDDQISGRESFQVVKSQSPYWKVGETFSDDDMSMGSRQVRFKSVKQGVAEDDETPGYIKYEKMKDKIASVLIKLYDQGKDEETIKQMSGRVARHLGYDPEDSIYQDAWMSSFTDASLDGSLDREPEDDYTDYTMRQGEMGRKGVAEVKGLKKRVKIVKGPTDVIGKFGTIGEVRQGPHDKSTKMYNIDLDGGGNIQLPGTALRLVKDQGVAENDTLEAVRVMGRTKRDEPMQRMAKGTPGAASHRDTTAAMTKQARAAGSRLRTDSPFDVGSPSKYPDKQVMKYKSKDVEKDVEEGSSDAENELKRYLMQDLHDKVKSLNDMYVKAKKFGDTELMSKIKVSLSKISAKKSKLSQELGLEEMTPAGNVIGKVSAVNPGTKKATVTKADGTTQEIDPASLKPMAGGKFQMDTPDEVKPGAQIVSAESSELNRLRELAGMQPQADDLRNMPSIKANDFLADLKAEVPEASAYINKLIVVKPDGNVNFKHTMRNMMGELISSFPDVIDVFETLMNEATKFINTPEFKTITPQDQQSIIELSKMGPVIQQMKQELLDTAKKYDDAFNQDAAQSGQYPQP